jgi:hypothetical protein
VHHLNVLAELEMQETSWVAGETGYSPDRQDAAVQGLAASLFPEALVGGSMNSTIVRSVAKEHLALPRETQMTRRGWHG